MIDKIIFYDADFLICFLTIGKTSILKKAFNEIIVPMQVFKELTRKKSPKIVKETIIDLRDSGFVKVPVIKSNSRVNIAYRAIKNGYWHEDFKKLGKGESAALAFAIEEEGVIASNNFDDIMGYVDKYELPLLTTSYFLALAFDEGIIDHDEAIDLYDRMIEEARKMPCNSFEEYYNSLYKKDTENFGFRLFE